MPGDGGAVVLLGGAEAQPIIPRSSNVEDIKDATLDHCDRLPLMFGVEATPVEDLYRDGTVLKLQPTVATYGRLAVYLQKHGLDRHALHGTLGQMLETLNHLVGLPLREDRQAITDVGRTITYGYLLERAKAELSKARRERLSHLIRTGVADQLLSGQPFAEGEIVLMGLVRIGDGEVIKGFDEITAASLGVLGRLPKLDSFGEFLAGLATD